MSCRPHSAGRGVSGAWRQLLSLNRLKGRSVQRLSSCHCCSFCFQMFQHHLHRCSCCWTHAGAFCLRWHCTVVVLVRAPSALRSQHNQLWWWHKILAQTQQGDPRQLPQHDVVVTRGTARSRKERRRPLNGATYLLASTRRWPLRRALSSF